MKQFLIFLVTVVILSACNGTPTVQTDNPSNPTEPFYPNEPSYPNAPSYPNEPVSEPPGNRPYSPQPGDAALSQGAVFLDSADILVMESYPVQIMLALKGSLPTPCNQLRVVANPPDDQKRIRVETYSVINPTQMCIQVLEPFEANIGLGSFPSGHYFVWVNEKMIGEFDS